MSLKKAVLSPAGLRVYKAAGKRINAVCSILYTVAFPIGASVLTVPARHARILAIFKFVFQVPTLVMSSADLRLDLLRCLISCYEFWFFSLMNCATCIVFSIHLGDMRMFLTPVYWYGVQMNIWADAKVQGAQLAKACALAAVYHVFLLAVFGMQLTPDAEPVELVRLAGRAMTSTDFLMNSFTTMMVLMMRTAYRKRALHKRSDDDPRVTQLVSYRCRVKFQRLDRTGSTIVSTPPTTTTTTTPTTTTTTAIADTLQCSSQSPAAAPEPTSSASDGATPASSILPPPPPPQSQASIRPATTVEQLAFVQQLRYVPLHKTFRSRNVIVPRFAALVTARSCWRLPLVYTIGALGLGMHVAAYACLHDSWLTTEELGSQTFVVLAPLGLACSAVFVGAFITCYQRRLVRRLLVSFDFLFLSMQITLSYVCFAMIVDWDARCLSLLTGWLWLHWALTLDALTPAMRTALCFRNRYAIPVLLIAVVMQITSSLHILTHKSEAVYARVFCSVTLFRHIVVMRAVPFYLSRGVTISLWLLRILWRLLTNGADELTLIQGSVQFFGNPKALRRVSADATAAAAAVTTTGGSTNRNTRASPVRQFTRTLLSSVGVGSKARIQPQES